jgi:hypothetical protein
MNLKDFILKNHEKGLTLKIYIYSFYYRFCINHIKMSKIEKMMGERGAQSKEDESEENLKFARLVAFHANRVTEHMPWEAKCYTRSLAIAKILKEKGIDTTIYMGVANEGGNMKAHSWIRCGKMYLTDPMMGEYTTVAKFKY